MDAEAKKGKISENRSPFRRFFRLVFLGVFAPLADIAKGGDGAKSASREILVLSSEPAGVFAGAG